MIQAEINGSPKFSSQLKKWFDTASFPLIIEGATVFFLSCAGLAMVQYATAALLGTDGYYHIKIGYLIRNEGWRPVFDHLPFTILNAADYYDHHYLYHAWLALFAWGNPLADGGVALTQGAKLASVLMAGFAFTAVWWLLKNQRIPFPFVWSVALLAVSEPFLYRMSMPRAQSLSLLLLVVAVHWLLQEKYPRLLGLGFVFVWAYNAFPLLVVVAAVYLIALWMTTGRIAWQAIAYPAAGIGLGLLINPYFPQNITFIIDHLAPKLGDSATQVGNEWSAYRTITLLENSGYTFLLLLLGILALSWYPKRIDTRTLFMLGLAVGFGYMLFESRRFIEYFPPFVLLFTAFTCTPILQQQLDKWTSQYGWLNPCIQLLALCILAAPVQQTLTGAADLATNSKPSDQYAQASLWLHDNAEADIQIFQTDWDDFSRLFFYNSDARFTAGLDPTFMELHNPELFKLWADITQGKVNQPGGIIREQFKADYIFSDLKHGKFEKQAADDPQLTEVYRDEYAVIYAVTP